MSRVLSSERDLVAVLSGLGARIHAGSRLADTLDAIANAVVEYLGFGVAAVNLRRPDGSFEVVAVAGSEEAARELLGTSMGKEEVFAEMSRADEWGTLRFIPHQRATTPRSNVWIPDLPISDDPDAWHPLDLLFAQLTAPGGELVGLLSVDVPDSGQLPDLIQRELLEALALQAGIAISSARLTEQVHAEREDLQREQARLAASEAAFRFSFDGSATGMALVSLNPAELGRFQRANDAFGRVLGYSSPELIQCPIDALIAAEDAGALRTALEQARDGALSDFRLECRFLRADDQQIWVCLTATVIDPGDARSRFLLIHSEDISDRRQREADLQHQASHDPLTGLPNRRLLLQRLDAAVSRAQRHGRTTTVLFCDLDGFKAVNDTFGHLVGDSVLQQAAGRLVEQVRSRDTVARLGGDEFVVLAEDLTPESAKMLSARISEAFSRPFDVIGYSLGVSTGLEAITASTPSGLAVLRAADEAMYRVKSSERSAGDQANPCA
ncbi:MAG TPA: diguanylate cyclase [Mycobacteriales bacterium]|nr:diguanylate cyclase [Mycobacteriales bacterium]